MPVFNSIPIIPVQEETNMPSFSTQMVYFTHFGKPLPLPRPRFRSFTNRVGARVYMPFRTNTGTAAARTNIKGMIPSGLLENMEDPIFNAPEYKVGVFVTFRMRRPNHHFRAGSNRTFLREGYQHERPTGGDLDNLLKFIIDSMNGVIYHDDCQVVLLIANKVWADDVNSNGSTTVRVWPMP